MIISTVVSIYIASAIYYNYELVKAAQGGWEREFNPGFKGVLVFIGLFIIGFIPVVNTLSALRLFKTRNINQ